MIQKHPLLSSLEEMRKESLSDAERELISDDAKTQILNLLNQGLKVCYLSSNSANTHTALCQEIKQANFNVSLFASAQALN